MVLPPTTRACLVLMWPSVYLNGCVHFGAQCIGLTGAKAQWHELGFLGSEWGAAGMCTCSRLMNSCTAARGMYCKPLNASYMHSYAQAVSKAQGVLTIDLQLLRNGSLNAPQVKFLQDTFSDT